MAGPHAAAWWLIVRAGTRRCALPIAEALETMRPQPLQVLTGLPRWVAGMAVIRGEVTAVLDLDGWLGGPGEAGTRWVTVRAGPRTVALAVAEVVGARRVAAGLVRALPPLLAHDAATGVDGVAVADPDLLLVLRSSRLVDDATAAALDRAAEGRSEEP